MSKSFFRFTPLLCLVVLLFLVTGCPLPYEPGIGEVVLYVNAANTGTEDGLAWDTAFNTVQEAIDAPVDASSVEIWVAAGIYTNGGGTDPVVTMKQNVHL